MTEDCVLYTKTGITVTAHMRLVIRYLCCVCGVGGLCFLTTECRPSLKITNYLSMTGTESLSLSF